MKMQDKQFKRRDKLSFKESALDLLRMDEGVRVLRQEDQEEFKITSRRYLENLTLPENRELARRIGVESATTLSKEALVNAMLDKIWGIQYFSDENPTLNQADPAALSPEEEISILERIKYGDMLLGVAVEGVFESARVGGVLLVRRFVRDIHDVCCLRTHVGEYGLRDGDLVTGRAVYIESAGFFCLTHIDKINDLPADKALSLRRGEPKELARPFKRLKLESADAPLLCRMIDLFMPFCVGQFGLIASEGRMEHCFVLGEVYRSIKFSGQADEVLFLCLYEREEILARMQRLYPNAVFTSIRSDEAENARIIYRALSYARCKAETGRNVVVLINNASVPYNEVLNPGDMVSSACQFKNGGSVSVLCGTDCDDHMGVYYKIKNLVDFECRIVADPYCRTYEMDIRRSYTYSDYCRTEAEHAAFDRLNHILLLEGNDKARETVLRYADNAALIRELK